MNREEERKMLIEEDQKFATFPPPDYSKKTNEQIRFRTELLKSAVQLGNSTKIKHNSLGSQQKEE